MHTKLTGQSFQIFYLILQSKFASSIKKAAVPFAVNGKYRHLVLVTQTSFVQIQLQI